MCKIILLVIMLVPASYSQAPNTTIIIADKFKSFDIKWQNQPNNGWKNAEIQFYRQAAGPVFVIARLGLGGWTFTNNVNNNFFDLNKTTGQLTSKVGQMILTPEKYAGHYDLVVNGVVVESVCVVVIDHGKKVVIKKLGANAVLDWKVWKDDCPVRVTIKRGPIVIVPGGRYTIDQDNYELTIENLQDKNPNDFGTYKICIEQTSGRSQRGETCLQYEVIRSPFPKFIECYKDSLRPRLLPNLLFSDRKTKKVGWANWKTYSCTLIERCCAAAWAKGHIYFGLENYGECWSGNTLANRPVSADRVDENWGTPGKNGKCLIGKTCTICVYLTTK